MEQASTGKWRRSVLLLELVAEELAEVRGHTAAVDERAAAAELALSKRIDSLERSVASLQRTLDSRTGHLT